MKRILLTILVCWVSLGYGQQTLFRIDGDDGSDANDGTSWPGFLTIGAAETDADFGAGDTLVTTGTFAASGVTFTTDGTSGNKCFLMDSTLWANGGLVDTVVDTSIIWGTIIDGEGSVSTILNFGGDNFWTIQGIVIKGATSTHLFLNNVTDLLIQQSKFDDGGDVANVAIKIQGSASTRDSVISNLFLESSQTNTQDFSLTVANATGAMVVLNNTFFSARDENCAFSAGDVKFRNNIVVNRSTDASGHIMIITNPSNVVADFNNNLYFEAGTITDNFDFNTSGFSTIAVWEDSVNNYDGDGATNSLLTDPELKSTATTAYILNTSAAAETGTDLGYGNDIGYYQVPAAGVARRRIPARVF